VELGYNPTFSPSYTYFLQFSRFLSEKFHGFRQTKDREILHFVQQFWPYHHPIDDNRPKFCIKYNICSETRLIS
ncbi:hypothetical protein, partial [Paenibacillus ginsengihumi]|uniref:hypothetical protein n=1 Tax=Paenibacillus ginsengihumi TaxID=431596 RepID=UPI001B7FD44B